jgi:hypothetical protein
MNAIWNPQANVYFELGRADPATIEGLSPQADTIEVKKLPPGFLNERDSGSALTFFLVRKVTDGRTADNGATKAKEGVSLIADSRSDSTMAHEAGHFLGALNEFSRTRSISIDSVAFGSAVPAARIRSG